MEITKTIRKLLDNETPFKVIKGFAEVEVQLFHTSKGGAYGTQITALRFHDGDLVSVYKTTGCGYCKEADALGNVLNDHGLTISNRNRWIESYHIGGNFYQIPLFTEYEKKDFTDSVLSTMLQLCGEDDPRLEDLTIFDVHGSSREKIEGIVNKFLLFVANDLELSIIFDRMGLINNAEHFTLDLMGYGEGMDQKLTDALNRFKTHDLTIFGANGSAFVE